jgi:hypothetical protein
MSHKISRNSLRTDTRAYIHAFQVRIRLIPQEVCLYSSPFKMPVPCKSAVVSLVTGRTEICAIYEYFNVSSYGIFHPLNRK